MATLKDVAKLANVDVSTVSRALNNTSYVHPDTKERIMAAILRSQGGVDLSGSEPRVNLKK